MNSDLEKKLAMLHMEYTKHLPVKSTEIENLWLQLKNGWDQSILGELHRKVHSLHGSAKIYDYEDIGNKAQEIEFILREVLDANILTEKQKSQIEQKIQELKYLISCCTRINPAFIEFEKNEKEQKIIYLFDDDAEGAALLAEQVSVFGYEIQYFEDYQKFLAAVRKGSPSALCINIHLMTPEFERLLLQLREDVQIKHAPMVIFSWSGEFSYRLQAVRLGGQVFLNKPFLIEDFIAKLDYIIQLKSEIYRILIVDDEVDVANYHSAILSHANMETRIVTHSTEVARALHEFKPDLLLIDLYMPECSGMELAAIIRQQSAYEGIPIIFLSSEEDRLKQLNAMRLGADDFVSKSIRPQYLVLTIRNRASRYKSLHSMVSLDYLTGLYNHSFILRQLEFVIEENLQTKKPFCVAMLDLDSFKNINDTYGHQAGDQVLRTLGLMMRKRLRPTDIAGRYGGEEFLIIMPNTELAVASEVIDDLRKQFLILMYMWNNKVFNATFSAGVVSSKKFSTAVDLIQAADKAMYIAKREGKNRIKVLAEK